jgi:hypothetical protein
MAVIPAARDGQFDPGAVPSLFFYPSHGHTFRQGEQGVTHAVGPPAGRRSRVGLVDGVVQPVRRPEPGSSLRLCSGRSIRRKAGTGVQPQLLSMCCQRGRKTPRSATIITGRVVPPRGFEPLISALKGRRPGPLDDGGGVRQRERAERIDPLALTGSGSWIRTNDLRVMSPTSYHCSIPRRCA